MWQLIFFDIILLNQWTLINGIFGGTEIGNRNAKFMATIRHKDGERQGVGRGLICGGCLVSPIKVLSAAHCFYNTTTSKLIPVQKLRIVLGTVQLYSLGVNALEFDIDTVYIKKGFRPETKYKETSDIAVATLQGSVAENNAFIQPIKLAEEEPKIGTKCIVMGWGDTNKQKEDLSVPEKFSDMLLYTETEIVKLKVCEDTWKIPLPHIVCAANLKGTPCPGDNGGPLICNNVLVGISKGIILCGHTDYPSLYTSVPQALRFINEVPVPPIPHKAAKFLSSKQLYKLILNELFLTVFLVLKIW